MSQIKTETFLNIRERTTTSGGRLDCMAGRRARKTAINERDGQKGEGGYGWKDATQSDAAKREGLKRKKSYKVRDRGFGKGRTKPLASRIGGGQTLANYRKERRGTRFS